MTLHRRDFLGFGAAVLTASAWASEFPIAGKPVRIVVPAAPGGPADLMARSLSLTLTSQLKGAPIVVESKPGGATVLGANIVASSPSDGYTLLLTINSTHTQVPHLLQKLPYDPFRDFTPICQLFRAGVVICGQPSLKAQNLKELVELSKSTEAISAASAGIGTNGHLYIEMLNRIYGAKFIHVPYKGASEGQRDLQAGIVQVYFDSVSSAIPHIKSGKVKALGVTGTSRIEALPQIPSCVEMGFSELDVTGWFGVFGPGGMPSAVVDTLNRAFVEALKSQEVRRQFEPLGIELTGTSAKEFDSIVRRDYATWGKVIKNAGIKMEQ
ncbi:tripartite tricarboxylate transporter substrate binding protein [Variovorax sp. EBFNA2]|uniref:Bug family tripartite tricarboxylate transporter substrate binding protein n=1 Tax=Variovorax sp. EBFNA2 TaxID=3342097 RepID=UPI0029C0C17B|nr:tripartite tricarboxylate transporter substrate binding protein [Variovorax boronicumulans]WPG41584.1 tripartite tricarboxylate transporter substrate binding protein [Variovorax boronicumulans]